MSDNRPKHSPIGASSMHRWKACPGSVELSRGLPNNPSIHAQEGTAAHELVGFALERAFSENRPTIEVLNDTIKALSVYTEYIEKLKGNNPCHIEHSFDMGDIFPDLYGTADCVIFDKSNKVLHIIDYKHGKGIPVEAKDNLQLSYYALGALTTLKYPCEKVNMTIVQPRCYHPAGPIRSWEVDLLYFIDFELELISAAKKTLEKNAPFKAGIHCQFCRAKPICKEKHSNALNEAKKQFTFYNDPKKEFTAI